MHSYDYTEYGITLHLSAHFDGEAWIEMNVTGGDIDPESDLPLRIDLKVPDGKWSGLNASYIEIERDHEGEPMARIVLPAPFLKAVNRTAVINEIIDAVHEVE